MAQNNLSGSEHWGTAASLHGSKSLMARDCQYGHLEESGKVLTRLQSGIPNCLCVPIGQHNAVKRIGCAVGTSFSITVLSHAALCTSSMVK